MGESGKIKAANFYRDCYPADDIPGVWMHKDFSSVAVSYEIFINGQNRKLTKTRNIQWIWLIIYFREHFCTLEM